MLFRWFESRIKVFTDPEDVMPPNTVWRFYFFYLKQIWPILLAILVAGFGVAFIEVLLYAFIARVVDMVHQTSAAIFFQEHATELLWMLGVVIILRPFFSWFQDLLINQSVTPYLTNRIRWQNHRYVIRQSLQFFHNDYSGRIANRIMQTGMSLRESTLQLIRAIWYVTVYVGSAVAMFMQADVWLAVPLLVWLVSYILLLRFFIPLIKDRSWQASAARSKLMGRIVDGYGNILTTKLFSHPKREEAYVGEAIADQSEKLARMTRVTTLLDAGVTTLNCFLIAITTGLSLWLWSEGRVSVGAIVLTTGLVIRISNMSGWIMFVVNMIFENVGRVKDGMTSISQPRQLHDSPNAKDLAVTTGRIDFDRVTFAYNTSEVVFDELKLTIQPGEKIGLVGPSGAGKSSLVNLLLRLYDIDAGAIRIDGQNVSDVTQQSLRAQIGMVTQEPTLLHRSVKDNILYGRPNATPEEIQNALREAQADTFVPHLIDNEGRKGMDALVGERGVKLSGGQRQRIAIARVLLKNAPILVLDEATSALDSETEAVIQESLETLMAGKTVIAIAHRLSTIARMDRLVVLDQGRIVETGAHEELIAANGLYARLWQHQTGGFVGKEEDAGE